MSQQPASKLRYFSSNSKSFIPPFPHGEKISEYLFVERKRRKGGRRILSVRSRRFRIQKFLKIDKSLLRILYEDRGKRAKDGEGPF